MVKAIPYGRHDKGDSNFPRIPAHISFAISQFIPGILVFSPIYFFQRNFDHPLNIIMYCLFTIHYINRSIVDGIASRHSQSKVSLWIPILAALVNILFHFVNAQFIVEARYCEGYYLIEREQRHCLPIERRVLSKTRKPVTQPVKRERGGRGGRERESKVRGHY